MQQLLTEIKSCSVCKDFLPNTPNPIVRASEQSTILIIGQAPGVKVDKSGIPWDDASGNELRRWLGVDKETFYNEKIFALVPMGFCYPGKGRNGDLPPRPECAPLWQKRLMDYLKNVKLTLLVGSYSQNYYLKGRSMSTLTETVRRYEDYLPQYLPLVHPSPRNKIWQKKNPWFETEVVPSLQELVAALL